MTNGVTPEPTLSVVVPVYDVEQYLRECLDSIVHQTLEDLEIVVVDDASPDRSASIAAEYQDRDARVRVIAHDENRGLGAARNTGVQHATGRWITFVDSDDRVERGCYAAALDLIVRHDADGAVFQVVQFDDATGEEDREAFPYNRAFDNPTRFGPDVAYHRIIGPTVWNRILRRTDLVDNGIWFPEGLKHEDEEFTFKYIAKVEPVLVHDTRYGYEYRQRAGSIMQASSTSRRDLAAVLVNVVAFLSEHGLLERYRGHVLSKVREFLGYFAGPAAAEQPPVSFIEDLRHVLEVVAPTREELDALPPFVLAVYMTDPDARACLLARQLPDPAEVDSDPWAGFNRLPRRRKLAFLARRSVRAAARPLRRSHVV